MIWIQKINNVINVQEDMVMIINLFVKNVLKIVYNVKDHNQKIVLIVIMVIHLMEYNVFFVIQILKLLM